MLKRRLKEKLDRVIKRGKSVLLLGPRQAGKTTLISEYKVDLEVNLLFSKVRRQYEADPDQLIREVEALKHKNGKPPLVVVDEVQKVPSLMDGVQHLIDKKLGQFILTGSSARKLRHGTAVNRLPGRLIQMRLDPLTLEELDTPLPDIKDFLLYGSLPAIRLEKDPSIREEELDSYVDLYLEDEIRAEALVRDIGAFENFLRLAAIESGNIINFKKISQDIGVAHSTIHSYYQILEDCLIAERIEPFTTSVTRKKLIKSPKYLLFDLGLRRLAAQEHPSLPEKYLGPLFEQFVGLELIKWSRLQQHKISLLFWRDVGGPEVDWLLKWKDTLIPIEVKWTETPSARDAKHLSLFLQEYPEAKKGFVVCRAKNPQALEKNIEAISWKDLTTRLNELFLQES
ncbi:ATP-binding protein [Candidatus Neptunochlamydia vexilliferae]|uniref:ATP-binding protein n=1 Tax=Candidatus Neptunichlamydia vexilliferae TaxID=1651774 RepID=UPI001890F6D4|nr:AAA family ATPase [Candidatus Neptunochlamydia vexilliferae]